MKKTIYILSAAVVLATACTREVVPEQPSVLTTTVAPKEGDLVRVTFDVCVPEAMFYATETRSYNDALFQYQPYIGADEIYVAVFGAGESERLGGLLQNFVKAKVVRDDNTYLDPPIAHNFAGIYGSTPTGRDDFKYKYEVLLPLSNDPLVLDFMVGACDMDGVPYTLDHPLQVGYEKDVLSKVSSRDGYCGYWQRKRISGVYPKMDGNEYVMTTYTSNGRLLPIQDQDYVADDIPELEEVVLIRNFAVVSFKAAEGANFMINNYCLVNTPKTGSIAPYSSTDGFNTAYTRPESTTPSILMEGYKGFVSSYELIPGIQTVRDKSWFPPSYGNFESSACMYERTIPTNSDPAFAESGAILEVNMYGLGMRYYKVSLVDNNGYVPILRNVVYQFIVSEIKAEYHPTTIQEALDGPFLGDISASVTTAMLDDISNNKSRIVVAGESGNNMSHTFIGSGKTCNVDFYFYPVASNSEVVVTDGKASTAAGGAIVTIKSVEETDGEHPQAIASVSAVNVTHNANGTDNHGTITVTLNDSEPGVVKKGKLKILGQVQGSRALYREVCFTVMEKQNFADGDLQTSVTSLASDGMNQETTVNIVLPDELPRDIFPLQIKIEAENNGLTSIPDKSVTPAISALPVKYGPSAFRSGNSYYFVKTITYDDYATLSGTSYVYTNEFPCKFKTRLSNGNATTIKINDLNEEFFVEKTIQLTVGQ